MKNILTVLSLTVLFLGVSAPAVYAGCSDDGSVCGPHISSVKIRPYGYYYNPQNTARYSYNQPWPRIRYQECDQWGGCSYYKQPWRPSHTQYNYNNYDYSYGGNHGCGTYGCSNYGYNSSVNFQVGYQTGYCGQWGC